MEDVLESYTDLSQVQYSLIKWKVSDLYHDSCLLHQFLCHPHSFFMFLEVRCLAPFSNLVEGLGILQNAGCEMYVLKHDSRKSVPLSVSLLVPFKLSVQQTILHMGFHQARHRSTVCVERVWRTQFCPGHRFCIQYVIFLRFRYYCFFRREGELTNQKSGESGTVIDTPRTQWVQRLPVRVHIQGVSRLVDITAGGDFLGLCDQKFHINVSDFGQLRSYDRLKLRIEGNDYWQ